MESNMCKIFAYPVRKTCIGMAVTEPNNSLSSFKISSVLHSKKIEYDIYFVHYNVCVSDSVQACQPSRSYTWQEFYCARKIRYEAI